MAYLPVNPPLRRPAPNHRCVCVCACRSGFTREYSGGGNGERPVEIGQQARPFRGWTRSYDGLRPTTDVCRSGFTREYGGSGNGERKVEIGQLGRPLRG